MTDPGPLMESEVEDGRVVVRLSGEIDLSNVEGLEAQIDGAIADARDVVIDLTAVEFIDSRGLRLLNRISASVAGRDGTLVVVAPSTCIARSVLDMTGMSQELTVRESFQPD
jgi:anti-sigma B factor antagonist